MKRIVVLFIFIINISIIAQPQRGGSERFHSGPKPIYIESHVIPSDSFNNCYISYRVPYSNLVFIKKTNGFEGGITFRIEATNEEGVIARESSNDKIVLVDYDETNRQDKYLEGVLSFKLNSDEATINPLIELDNTDRQVPLRPFNVEANQVEPMVVMLDAECQDSHGYSIINYENSIPFDNRDHQLMIPIFDSDVDKIKVEVSQNGDQIVKKDLTKISTLSIGLSKCKNNIVLINDPQNIAANIFFLDSFSKLLGEGPFNLTIMDEADSVIYDKEMNVSWTDKPLPLMNPKYAYEMLELMESEDKLDEIYDKADGEYQKAIWLFWEKYDPDKNSKFNELMYEFYSRAEKAIKEYSTKGNKFGVLSDRAKVFIKYGKPSEVDRYYSDKDEITEIWKYISPKVEFVFVDATGLGNYKLVN